MAVNIKTVLEVLWKSRTPWSTYSPQVQMCERLTDRQTDRHGPPTSWLVRIHNGSMRVTQKLSISEGRQTLRDKVQSY